MPWPWQSSEASNREKTTSTSTIVDALNPTTVLSTLALTTFALSSAYLYRTRLRRIPSAGFISPSRSHESLASFPARHSLFGAIVRVPDGDGIRLYHTPGGRLLGWGWLRSVPSEPFPRQKRGTGGDKSWLAENTINVRLSGIDAPELAHFGRPVQSGAEEATERLKALSMGKWARVYPHHGDQYGRIVGTVFVRSWHLGGRWGLGRWVDVGMEVVRDGWATVYEGKIGVAFGGKKREEVLRKLEAVAKEKRVGIWRGSGPTWGGKEAPERKQDVGVLRRMLRWVMKKEEKTEPFESPRDFKARMKKQDAEEKGNK